LKSFSGGNNDQTVELEKRSCNGGMALVGSLVIVFSFRFFFKLSKIHFYRLSLSLFFFLFLFFKQ